MRRFLGPLLTTRRITGFGRLLLGLALLLPAVALVHDPAAQATMRAQPRLLSLAAQHPDQAISVIVQKRVQDASVEALVARTGYSRFPVVLDGGMTGYVHVKDLLGAPDRDRPVDPALVRALPAVGADSSLRAALRQMQTTGAHLIRVLVEDDRLIGVVMLEDALEELVGEVTDAGRRA